MFSRRREKEEDYFDMFVVSVEFSCKIAEDLHDIVLNYNPETIGERATKMHEIEHAADQHYHKIFKQLSRSFITPIEREDILLLSESIDELTDAIEEVAYAFYILNIDELRDDVPRFVELIIEACDLLKSAVTVFKDFKKSDEVFEMVIDVSTTEEEGDRYYYKAVRKLFTEETDPIKIIKWREVYDKLEECLDACEDVADNLEGIVLKNS